ncbi:hypothetical protein EDB89DRAFT_2063952 [Lactarius sanguifluus]|nr:hypothetical protein EDB89DRAFT_2063952 [Lactarius sanguifluus]
MAPESPGSTASVCGPLTPALGLKIAALATPYAEGTGAIYLSEHRDSEKIFILTARHVVLPLKTVANKLYNHTQTGQRGSEVVLPGSQAFQTVLESTKAKIEDDGMMVNQYSQQLDTLRKRVARGDKDGIKKERKVAEGNLRVAEESIESLEQFRKEAMKYWSEESQRVIGHVVYSPPITFGTGIKRYTEDWALIELDRSKINWDNFRGNVIDLGTEIPVPQFTRRMYPDIASPTSFNSNTHPIGYCHFRVSSQKMSCAARKCAM